jgi:hypothetical protein
MTLMSSHTFTNEPDGQSVEGALKYVYHHHDKKELFKCISNAELNTWDSVVDKYMEVFLNVGQREKANRFRY